MIQIHKNTTIYILAPSQSASGGQEALHQLAFYMQKEQYPVMMSYYGHNGIGTPVHSKYEQYSIPYNLYEEIEDKKNIIICPEIATDLLYHFQNVTKAVWWLSIGFFKSEKRYASRLRILTNMLRFKFTRVKESLKKRKEILNFNDTSIYHFTGSHFALHFIQKQGIHSGNLLIEPLGRDFIDTVITPYHQSINLTSKNRKKQILYNPLKPSILMRKFMKAFPHYTYIPLKGLTPEGLVSLMKESRLYIDFGKFPGPERLPKEAAICGCCILTGTNGAAAFYGDVRIPEEFKISHNDLPKIKEKIDDLLDNYDDNIAKFQPYRDMVLSLESNFIGQIKQYFVKNHTP